MRQGRNKGRNEGRKDTDQPSSGSEKRKKRL